MWVAAQMALLAAVVALGPLWPGEWPSNLVVVCGRVLLMVSAVFAVSGFAALGRNLSPYPRPRAGATLVRHGIYSLVRHPLYASLMLGSIGWALVWRSGPALASAVLLALVLQAKAKVEERWLRERFPEYADYARHVRRFIPWVY